MGERRERGAQSIKVALNPENISAPSTTLPLLFEILHRKGCASQERAALRIGPWLQVPVNTHPVEVDPVAEASTRRTKRAAEGTIPGGHSMGSRLLRQDPVRPLPRFALRGLHLQPQLFDDVPANKPANAVVLPVGRFCNRG